jgi:HSP20 family protein
MNCSTHNSSQHHIPFENSFQLFNSLVNDILPNSESTARPALTIIDHEDRYVIECDLPGVVLDDINLEVHDGVLEISGERKKTELPKGSSVQFNERFALPFRRCVKLGKTVDTSSINADFDNGVLVVTALRMQDTLPRKINISRSAVS